MNTSMGRTPLSRGMCVTSLLHEGRGGGSGWGK
jgi:hypothetical protein